METLLELLMWDIDSDFGYTSKSLVPLVSARIAAYMISESSTTWLFETVCLSRDPMKKSYGASTRKNHRSRNLNWVHALQRLPNSWTCCQFHLLAFQKYIAIHQTIKRASKGESRPRCTCLGNGHRRELWNCFRHWGCCCCWCCCCNFFQTSIFIIRYSLNLLTNERFKIHR